MTRACASIGSAPAHRGEEGDFGAGGQANLPPDNGLVDGDLNAFPRQRGGERRILLGQQRLQRGKRRGGLGKAALAPPGDVGQAAEHQDARHGGQPPVVDMKRETAGCAPRSMWKSWPLGLASTAARIAASSAASSAPERITARRSLASSRPRQVCNVPVQVSLTRLQPSQKLWLSGVMKPRRPPVSAIWT